jgi:hypothetical protein
MIKHLQCPYATRLLSDRLERSLSCVEGLCLRVHLLGCTPCRRFGRALRWLHHRLPASPHDERLPEQARERIRHALEQAIKEK